MIDGNNDTPQSAVKQVANLKSGETYCRAEFIPAFGVTPGKVKEARARLTQALSPVVSRARQLSFGEYEIHTIHSFTKNYDVVVAGLIVCKEPAL